MSTTSSFSPQSPALFLTQGGFKPSLMTKLNHAQKHKPAPSQEEDAHKSRQCSAPGPPAWRNATVQRAKQLMRAGGISGDFSVRQGTGFLPV